MKQFLSVIAFALAFNLVSGAFAASPITASSKSDLTIIKTPAKKFKKQAVELNDSTETGSEAPVKSPKKVKKVNAKLAKKAAKGDDMTVATILALVSILIFPFGLHNWYLGRTKQALWQTLLVIPGFILIIPPVISWIWQFVDFITLLVNGSLN